VASDRGFDGAGRATAHFHRAMSAGDREQILGLIQAHLADELDLEPEAIGEQTRFREDLEADSLDLYTLVQELEDTYGVKMSDDQAAQILTVAQAIDFVLAHGGRSDVAR
jgi:acyl carrier protein